MTFVKFCKLCDYLIATFHCSEEAAENMAMNIFDLLEVEYADKDVILKVFEEGTQEEYITNLMSNGEI